jgi:hypothetical protein
VPLQQQVLHFNGKEMNNAVKLSAIGVHDGDLVMMVAANNRFGCWPYTCTSVGYPMEFPWGLNSYIVHYGDI